VAAKNMYCARAAADVVILIKFSEKTVKGADVFKGPDISRRRSLDPLNY
jgi:hypothetical protein